MRSDSIVFAIAGICFGIILGWVIGTQQATRRTGTVVQMQSGAAEPQQGANQQAPGTRQPPALDEAKVLLKKMDPTGPDPDRYVQSNFEAMNFLKLDKVRH